MALFSALQKFITKDGQPVEGASVIVKLAGSATPATLYATRDGGAKSNPFLTDSAGNALCYVSPGRYDMTVTFNAEQVTFNDVEVGPVSQVGSFTDGVTLTDPDQWVRDNDGALWEYTGSTANFPLQVAPGSAPDGNFRVVVPNGGRQVGSVDSLRNTKARFNGEAIQLVSYHAGANEGGGVFAWDAASTAADDGRMVIAVTGVAVGRWVRQFSKTDRDLINQSIYNNINPSRPMELISHRGFVIVNRAQNTLYALKKSIQQGADSVEFDVQFSSDGVAYLFHDDTVDALTFGTGQFSSLTSAYIDTLRFRATSGTRLEDVGVTKLNDVITWLKKSGVYSYPELKSDSTDRARQLIDIFNAAGLTNRVTIQSAFSSVQQAMLSYDPYISVGVLSTSANESVVRAIIDSVSKYRGRVIVLSNYVSLFSIPNVVKYARDLGVDFGAWAVNSQNEADQIMSLGVYKIMSDIQLFKGV